MANSRKQALLGISEGSKKYKEINEAWDKIERENEERIRKASAEREYQHKATMKILHLIDPIKSLNKSKLLGLKRDQLDEIGKGARIIYDAMNKAGMIPKNTVVYKSGE